MARLPGMVQGVVVQMTTQASTESLQSSFIDRLLDASPSLASFAKAHCSVTGNFTQIVSLS